MPQASRTIDVQVGAERLFHVLSDYQVYPSFLSEMRRVETLEVRGHEKTVRFELLLFKVEVVYILRLLEEPYRRISWKLLESNWLNSVNGEWRIETPSREKCRLTYKLEIGIKGLVPRIVSTQLSTFYLPAMLEHFKERAEQFR